MRLYAARRILGRLQGERVAQLRVWICVRKRRVLLTEYSMSLSGLVQLN